MFTEARRTAIGAWEVFCTDCAESIGTMTGDALGAAVQFACTRGGLKCPTCRINSCPRCHYYSDDGTLCALCRWEVNEEKSLYNIVPV